MPRRNRPEQDERPAWAKWLVEQRELRGWLQREFADRLNVSQQSLSGYERGAYRVPEDVAEHIAEVLELPYLEVRTRLGMYVPSDVRESFEGEVIRLPAGIQLTPRQRKALKALIEAFLEAQDAAGNPGRDIVWVDSDSGPRVELLDEPLRPAASDV